MTNSTYETLKTDASGYENGYNIFLSRSNFRNEIAKGFEKIAPTKLKKTQVLRAMDLGCGNGEMTKRYLEVLKKVIPLIHLTLLEPAEKSLNSAMDLLRPEVIGVESVKKLSDDYSYDLIIASYVFYHLPTEVLNEVVSLLEPRGSLVIMMGTSDHPLKSHPGLKEISNHGSSDKLNPFLENLQRNEDFNISRHKVKTSLNLKGLWKDGEFTDEAKILLSFSLNKNFNELNENALKALKDIFTKAFQSNDGNLHSIHEIIWIERIE